MATPDFVRLLVASIPLALAGAAVGQSTPPRATSFIPAPGCVNRPEGLTMVTVGFDAPIAAPPGAVRVFDSDGLELHGFLTQVAPAGDQLTVIFDEPVTQKRVRVIIDSTVAGAGIPLDGEIADPASPSLPSGNGFAGGQAVALYNVLPGDATCDGVVDGDDAQAVLASLGLFDGDPGFDPAADFNGDGVVNVLDVATWSLNNGTALPPTDGVAPNAEIVSPPPGAVGGAESLTIAFSEPMRFAALSSTSLAVNDESGGALGVAAVTALDAQTASFQLDAPLETGVDYTVTLSTALVDLSGELLDPASSSFTLGPPQDRSIFPPRSFPVGENPSFAAAGDLNADGLIDYVITNFNDDTVSVLLGDGDGTFAPQRVFPVGASPSGVTLGDFDGDGDLDAAVALEGEGAARVLYGDGTGDLGGPGAETTLLVGGTVVFIASGPLTADARPDLAIVDAAGGRVAIRVANADRTFSSRPDVSAGIQPSAAALGDLVGGPEADLAVTDEAADVVRLFEGQGDGLFAAGSRGALSFPTGGQPVYVGIGDLDNDKDLDLVTSDRGGSSVTVVKPRAARGLAFQTVPVGDAPVYAGIGDLDNDKDLDLLTADSESDTLTPVVQQPGDVFAPAAPLPTGDRPVYTRIEDVNGDGVADVVTLLARDGDRDGALTVRLGTGGGEIPGQQQITAPENGSALALASLTGIGAPDILVAGERAESSVLDLLSNDGNGAFAFDNSIDLGGSATEILTGDVFGTGDPAILVIVPELAEMLVFEADGKGGYLPPVTIFGVTAAAIGEFDPFFAGEELVVARVDKGGDIIQVLSLTGGGFRGSGSTISLETIFLSGGDVARLTVDDLDGDGADDIIGLGEGGAFEGPIFKRGGVALGVVAWVSVTQRGSGVVLDEVFVGDLGFGLTPIDVAVADTNTDEERDVVVATSEFITFRGELPESQGFITIFRGAGDLQFEQGEFLVAERAISDLATGDFNDDGLDDFAAPSPELGEIVVFVSDGVGAYFPPQRYEAHVSPLRIETGDVNGDGALDLVVLNAGSGDLSILLGQPGEPVDVIPLDPSRAPRVVPTVP